MYDLGSHCRILLPQVVERSNRPEAIEATCNMFSRPSLIRFNEFFLKDRKHMKLGGKCGGCMRRRWTGSNGGEFNKTCKCVKLSRTNF